MVDEASEAAQHQGVFEWSWGWVKDHLDRFLLGGMVFSSLIVVANASLGLPTSPSWSQVVVNGLVGLSLAALTVLFLSSVIAVLAAPYQQRNELRSLRAVENMARQVPQLSTELQLDQHNRPRLRVTNNGPVDSFRVFAQIVGDDSTKDYLAWDIWHHTEGRGKPKTLEKGAHAHLWPTHWESSRWEPPQDEYNLLLTFLSTRDPLEVELSVRRTRLGVIELKFASQDWPTRGEEWRDGVVDLMTKLERAESQLRSLTVTPTGNEHIEATNTVFTALSQSRIVGDSFRQRQMEAHTDRLEIPHSEAHSEHRRRLFVAAYLDCISAWLAELRAELRKNAPV